MLTLLQSPVSLRNGRGRMEAKPQQSDGTIPLLFAHWSLVYRTGLRYKDYDVNRISVSLHSICIKDYIVISIDPLFLEKYKNICDTGTKQMVFRSFLSIKKKRGRKMKAASEKEVKPFEFDVPLLLFKFPFLNHFLIGVGGGHSIFIEKLKEGRYIIL